MLTAKRAQAELTHLSSEDIRDWFVERVKDLEDLTDFACREEARLLLNNALPRRDGIPRTDHIEALLTDRYNNSRRKKSQL